MAAAAKPFALSKWLSLSKGKGRGGRGSGAHTARLANDKKLISALACANFDKRRSATQSLPAARKTSVASPGNGSDLSEASEALSRDMRHGEIEFNRTHADVLVRSASATPQRRTSTHHLRLLLPVHTHPLTPVHTHSGVSPSA